MYNPATASITPELGDTLEELREEAEVAEPACIVMLSVCVICFCEAEQGLRCSNHHFICDSCIEPLVLSVGENLAERNDLDAAFASARDEATALELKGRLQCPCAKASVGACNAAPFTDADVAHHVSQTAFEKYLHARTLLPVAQSSRRAYEDAQEALREELGQTSDHPAAASSHGRVLLAKQLASQMPDARQCRECGLGPVDHFACSDLGAHQGHAGIDNSCKGCGWFSAAKEDWPAWDGTLHEEVETSANEANELLTRNLETAEQAAKEAKRRLALYMEQAAIQKARMKELRESGAKELARQRKAAEEARLRQSELAKQVAELQGARDTKIPPAAAFTKQRQGNGGGPHASPQTATAPLPPRGRAHQTLSPAGMRVVRPSAPRVSVPMPTRRPRSARACDIVSAARAEVARVPDVSHSAVRLPPLSRAY
jgi:hypothetical protein